MTPRGKPPPYSETPLSQKMNKLRLNSTPAKATAPIRLAVGVDFGTTSSGVSYAFTDNAHSKTLADIFCIRGWPGPGRDTDGAWKVPSRIAYALQNGLAFNAWGFDIKPDMECYGWMKLLLDPAQRTKYDDPSLANSEGSGVLNKPINKTAVDICADYLTELIKHSYRELEKRLSKEVLVATPIDFWFTVPAVWSWKAKADTLRAARKAARLANVNIHPDSQIFLIREPEAGAIAVLSDLTRNGSEIQIKMGDSVMVVDCGGGTVDITSYEITGISPKLTFKELLIGTGGKCGSTYIDREFIKWMTKKFGRHYTSLPWAKRGPGSKLMIEFEAQKRDFGKNKDPSHYFEVPLLMKDFPDGKYYDDTGTVNIFQSDMKAMFDPVIAMITTLLQSQLDAERRQSGFVTIKTMLLVGGFGDSMYLNDELDMWAYRNGIRLFCPEHPQSAVMRGAALSGLQNIQPTSRRSRMHYGWACAEPYDPVRHDARDLCISIWDGSHQAAGNMRWPMEKGQLVDESTSVTFTFTHVMYENSINQVQPLALYYSTNDDAPHYLRGGGSQLLATINMKFDNIASNSNSFEYKTYAGARLRRASAGVKVEFGHRRGVLVFTAVMDGQPLGVAEVVFDGESTTDVAEALTRSGGGPTSPSCATQ